MNSIGDSKTFTGTAKYYAKYRPGIPTKVVDYLRDKYHLDGRGLLLDIGCGTGISTTAFAPLFSKVIAFDPSQEMLDEAVASSDSTNIEWRLCSAEDLDLRDERVRLAIAVRSFHWIDQDSFLRRLCGNMENDGAIAIISDGSFWTGKEPWQIKIKEVIQEYLGSARKAGKKNNYAAPQEPFATILKRNGFWDITSKTIPITRHWTPDSIIGYLYTTSFSSYNLYNGRNADFERRLRNELAAINGGSPDFIENAKFDVLSGQLAKMVRRK